MSEHSSTPIESAEPDIPDDPFVDPSYEPADFVVVANRLPVRLAGTAGEYHLGIRARGGSCGRGGRYGRGWCGQQCPYADHCRAAEASKGSCVYVSCSGHVSMMPARFVPQTGLNPRIHS